MAQRGDDGQHQKGGRGGLVLPLMITVESLEDDGVSHKHLASLFLHHGRQL